MTVAELAVFDACAATRSVLGRLEMLSTRQSAEVAKLSEEAAGRWPHWLVVSSVISP